MDEGQITQHLTGALNGLDLAVFGGLLAGMLLIAFLSGRKESDTREFFLGGRRIPAFVVCLSFVATEISALTIVGVPATGYRENWEYLQFFLGSAAARVLIAVLFIPVFYRFNCTTIYEFLLHRFGPQTRYAGSMFFFVTRLLASGVRLYAACLGISVILGWSLWQALLLFTAVSIAMIAFGGIKAVVWTGAYETLVFYAAGLAVVGYLLAQVRGPLADAWHLAAGAGRLKLLNFNLSPSDPNALWAATLNALFLNLAVFGTDQELMQRLLTAKTRRSSQKAVLGTIVAALPLVCTYLAVGTLLFVFYAQRSNLPVPQNPDEILPHFVIHSLPFGLKGLLLAAIVLASIDSPLSSLASSFVTDLYKPLIRKNASEKHYLLVSRAGVVGFGILLAVLASLFSSARGILWVGFKVLAVTGGSTLGVFLLGLLTRRRANRGNVVAMIVSAAAMLGLLLWGEMDKEHAIGWTWLIVIGTCLTFGLAWLLGQPESATDSTARTTQDS